MQVSEAIEDFRFSILHLAPGTQQWYLWRLEAFASWCSSQGIELEQLKRKMLATYLDQLRSTPSKTTGKPLSSHTVHGHARAIRAFLNFCAKDDDLQRELSSLPTNKVPMPRLEKKLIKTLTQEQIQAMFAACDKEYLPHLVVRDRAILSLLLDTGIRASELCNLTLDCVFLKHDSHIRVHGKGDKWREVSLGIESSKALHRYISRYRPASTEEKHVFIGRFHEPMRFDGLKQLLYRLRDFAGLDHNVRVNAHVWRHTFAMNYLRQGGDIYALSRLMGHESIHVTQMYAQALKSEQARKISGSVLDRMF